MKSINLKFTLLMIGGFILTAITGSMAVEGTRIITGKYQGYESAYVSGFGTYIFYSEQIGKGFENLKQPGQGAFHFPKHQFYNEFNHLYRPRFASEEVQASEEWNALIKKDQGNKAIIEASGMLLVLILTLFGIAILKRGRTRKDKMTLRHWVGFFVSLIFVRYLVLYAFMIYTNSRFCQEFSVFGSMGFDSLLPVYILEAAGILLAVWIVLQIPRRLHINTVVAGILGGFTGLALWMKWVGPVFEN